MILLRSWPPQKWPKPRTFGRSLPFYFLPLTFCPFCFQSFSLSTINTSSFVQCSFLFPFNQQAVLTLWVRSVPRNEEVLELGHYALDRAWLLMGTELQYEFLSSSGGRKTEGMERQGRVGAGAFLLGTGLDFKSFGRPLWVIVVGLCWSLARCLHGNSECAPSMLIKHEMAITVSFGDGQHLLRNREKTIQRSNSHQQPFDLRLADKQLANCCFAAEPAAWNAAKPQRPLAGGVPRVAWLIPERLCVCVCACRVLCVCFMFVLRV